MTWSIVLNAYKSSLSDVGHAFATVERSIDGNNYVMSAAGLSPRELPGGMKDELSTIIPKPGMVYSEFDSLTDPNLRRKRFPISEGNALKVMNKINADRRLNSGFLPDSDGVAADVMTGAEDLAGGPGYSLFGSNCATYALDLLKTAGINTSSLEGWITRPGAFFGMLEDAAEVVSLF